MTLNTQNIKHAAFDPISQFLKKESSSSILMLIAMASAMILANSGYSEMYHNFWQTKFGATFGSVTLYKPIILWINDGLMAIFFLVIGLEIKREILIGELSTLKQALLPLVGAIGGAVIPALIYITINYKGGIPAGWGVPMATDIAFAIGIMALLGSRVPIQLKIFITSLAVVDDMIAVLVIAFFYTSEILTNYLFYAGITIFVLILLNVFKVRAILAYLVVGVVLWYFFLKSGIHATIAGVILAFFIPSEPRIPMATFKKSMGIFMVELKHSKNNPDSEIPTKEQKYIFNKIIHASLSAYNPMSRLEYNLHSLSAFLIMPLFAFANTGVTITSGSMTGLMSQASLGIIFGLMLGKPIGIMTFLKLGQKFKLIEIPAILTNSRLFGASVLSGIGLTMSIFIASMAFSADFVDIAKLSIVIVSVICGISGYLILRNTSNRIT
ncbi:MAG: Na+/H+ antiporter NhaA [Denitrovibrio sp.]|nr:MAG: Na+/H+ antiporter NhaA [Denitrovibrio sp.]